MRHFSLQCSPMFNINEELQDLIISKIFIHSKHRKNMQHKTYLLESFCFSLVVFFPVQKVIIKIAKRKIVTKRPTDSTTSTTTTSGQTDPYKHTTWIPRWLKRRGNDHFHIVSTWNPCGVFLGIGRADRRVLQVDK